MLAGQRAEPVVVWPRGPGLDLVWPLRPVVQRPAPAEIHVWAAPLEAPPMQQRRYRGMLSRDEQDRAARFRFEEDRSRWVTGRGVLREILGAYLEVEPERIRFGYSEYGKPSLAHPPSQHLRFNIAHSGGLMLCALSCTSEVGVDVERIVPRPDLPWVAARFFSPAERGELANVAPGDGLVAFYCCWTRKEAYLKASGCGLSQPLDSFDVSIQPYARPKLLRIGDDAAVPREWSLTHLEPAAGYVGALACRQPGAIVYRWTWPGER